MRTAIKRRGSVVSAYELGAGTQTEREMRASGRIRLLADGRYEIFSREAVNGSGQIAQAGDFFKLDGGGFPYPNAREDFLSNHRRLDGDRYEQIPKPLLAWTAQEPICPQIEFLLAHRGLTMDEAHPERFFSAPLWGTMESAARDAVIVFYSLAYGDGGEIVDAVFNFVERGEFERTYEWLA